MDDSRGNLVPITLEVAKAVTDARAASVFEVGEVLEIKQSRFRIITLGKKYMKLKLLPREF